MSTFPTSSPAYGGYGGDEYEYEYETYNNDGTYIDGGTNPYQQHPYYEDGNNGNLQQHPGEYYDDGDGSADYYGPEGEEQQQQHQQQHDENAEAGAPNSLFHPARNRHPFVVHPDGRPDDYGNYGTSGDPISAMAFDDGDAANGVPNLLYLASHTSRQGDGRGGSGAGGRRGPMGLSRGTPEKDPSLSRGSRMTVLYDYPSGGGEDRAGGFYGGRSLYSSFVAHPEAERTALDNLHGVLFGGGANPSSVVETRAGRAVKARPSHAYGPPFGPPCIVHDRSAGTTGHYPNPHHAHTTAGRPEERHCMGISAVLPVSTPHLGSGGRVCTVSPDGVRVHTRGGMVMSSATGGSLTGMVCGTLSGDGGGRGGAPGDGAFATVGGRSFPAAGDGGPSSPSVSGGGGRAQHVHCVDLRRDLGVVSSHALVRDGPAGQGSCAGDDGSNMCVTDLAADRERCSVVAGCSDGTMRVLDGRRRNAEVAKSRAQVGGVARVALKENLICTSGYDSPGVSSPNSPLPYPFPSAHVLLYDIRYLGRGGIPHMFSTMGRRGPRFVNFLDDGNLLMGSGQTFGGFEVIAPFRDSAGAGVGVDGLGGNTFFQPELTAGEAMTTVEVHDAIDGEALYIGTSYGRVLQYGLNCRPKTTHALTSKVSPHSPLRSMCSGSGGVVGVPPTISRGSSFGDGVGLGAASTGAAKEQLDMPPFVPSPPPLSIDPTVLCSSQLPSQPASPELHHQPMRGWNVFDSYVLSSAPLLSSDQALLHPRYSRSKFRTTTLRPMVNKALVPPSKRWLNKTLSAKLEESNNVSLGSHVGERGSMGGGTDFVKVLPTSSLELGDLLAPGPSPVNKSVPSSHGGVDYRGKNKEKNEDGQPAMKSFSNPNKLLYSSSSFAVCYDATADPRRKHDRFNQERYSPSGGEVGEEFLIHGEEHDIPLRYRLTLRPPFYKASQNAFDYTQHNHTGLYLGWDYAPTFANSFACSVLSMLYFVGEVREMALGVQLKGNQMVLSSRAGTGDQVNARRRETNVSITAELGLLFYLIEMLSANGMIQPSTCSGHTDVERGQVKAFVPSNFIGAFASLPEAMNLALVDGVAGSAEIARRPEAFYRFLMQYMEKELAQLSSSCRNLNEEAPNTAAYGTNHGGHFIDRLQGVGFLSIIEYARGKPKISTSRNFTVDLAYESNKATATSKGVRFGEILRSSLCKESPLRAWCDETRTYEAVVQRKIATNLPSLLSLSCCCAGRGSTAGNQSHGLRYWQHEDSQNWLPEFIKISIEMDRSITVKELAVQEDGTEEWMKFEQNIPLSDSLLGEEVPQQRIEKSYQLDAVVSFIRTNSGDPASKATCEGHHVVHVRAPVDFEGKLLAKQLRQIDKCEKDTSNNGDKSLDAAAMDNITLVSDIPLEERRNQVQEQIRKLKEKDDSNSDQWLLLNGFVVTKIDNSDDIRSFNAKFKEPSIVLFREITSDGERNNEVAAKNNDDPSMAEAPPRENMVPVSVMKTTSISNGCGPQLANSDLMNLPGCGDLVAIDAEFVCVQPEESLITSSGSKEITSEPRNVLARLSIIDCRTNDVFVNDYVLPQEPVVDYLTRFSGIRQNDLDAAVSPHHLVTPQEAYFKVRLLMERGCIFVGHGLSQDFRVINICIPPCQIIDTAEIFHQPNQRYISLRYLTNYVLGRDMQQEVHDSIEDAKAAHELYIKALDLKAEGKFDDYLMQLYSHGHLTQFKSHETNTSL